MTSGLTQVYSGTYSVTTTVGWHKIVLDNPFSYNNSDNLLISFDDNTGSSSINDNFFVTDHGTNRTLYDYSDDSDIDPSSPPESNNLYTYCADVKLMYSSGSASTLYIWDTSSAAGIQGGSGTWGSDNYWTLNGTSLVAWPGAGNSATFAGSDGTWTITVSATQNVDSIYFGNSGYTLSSGTVNLGSNSGITIASGKTATISAVIAGTGGLSVKGGTALLSTLNLSGTNTYTGVTTLTGPSLRCNLSTLADGGSNSAIGAASSSASNLVLNGGQLRYTGSGA
ncbi:MAG: hypothetical protein JXA18_01575, partial [Chitinispirillaceae bacterium]|nr:hypothetical protein [Chitinispirillaceae bacterium]